MRSQGPSPVRWVRASVLTLVVVVHGCKVGPDYEPPVTTVPDVWHESVVRGVADGEATVQRWWSLFDDPFLEQLVRRAEQGNLDLLQAVGRIREARALVRVASGQMFPEVNAVGEASRTQLPENALGGLAPPGGFPATDLYSAGFDAVWELDFFGRIRRSIESAAATYEASIEDYRDVLVTLFAEVARNYVDVRTFQLRLSYARANVEAQRETLQLTRDRFAAGLVSALDVAQAESNLANSEARIPILETGLALALNRLAVLLGQAPGELDDELVEEAEIPATPPDVIVGLPADLLRQRPDVRRAERDLAAQTARIGVAVADLYPRFSLTGFLGLQSMEVGDLGDSGSVSWSFGLPFSWNLFDGGRRRGVVDAERARTEQQLRFYEQTVLLALEEVENSLVAYDREQGRRERLLEAVSATERSVELVRTQYMAGLTNFQNVLDTERSLFSQQDELAASEGLVVQSLIAIYKALGGGWSADPARPEHMTSGALAVASP